MNRKFEERNYKLTLTKYEWMICRAFAYGMSYNDMCLFFGTKRETLSTHLKRSRKKLKRYGYSISSSIDMAVLVEKGYFMIEEEGFKERWVNIIELSDYWISDEGRVFNLTKKKIVKPVKYKDPGYIRLTKEGKVYKRSIRKLMSIAKF